MTASSLAAGGDSIIIIGAGVFGLSTALELKKRGYENVTVLDRYLPPVIDGSSVDISRVIRTDYADPLYAKMALEAYQGWTDEYKNYYHHSGFVMLANQTGNAYIEKSQKVNESMGSLLEEFEDASDVRKLYPTMQANFQGLKAYHNPRGGWADAEASIRYLAGQCTLAGVSFITGARGRVLSLAYEGTRVVGVNVAEGGRIDASLVIVAAGAWTNRLLLIDHATSASGQPVGFIQLTDEEAKKLENMPVIINLSTGIFCFPPTPGTNILKIARHGYGFATHVPIGDGSRFVSSPKRDSENVSGSYLPEDAEEALREGLKQLLPDFEKHTWMNRRLCWYSDTPQGHFVVDHHPKLDGLFVASGGAGHAFKFLPVLGKYIVDCFENKAPEDVRQKWKLKLPDNAQKLVMIGDGSRGGPPLRRLKPQEMARL